MVRLVMILGHVRRSAPLVVLALALLTTVAVAQRASGPEDLVLPTAPPQTGGPLHLWPPRPGPPWRLNLPPQVPPAQTVATEPQFVPNEVLVQFRPDTTENDRAAARNAVGAVAGNALRGSAGRLERLPTALEVANAIAILEALPQVEFAEPNWIVQHQATSNDPYYTDGLLWGMYGNGSSPANEFGSQAGELWARGFTGSSSVYVGVIDEGIDFNHPDLAANIWTNPFDPVDGLDNDGNGYVDDVRGWDFFNNDNSIYDGSASDLEMDAHGTHVAGTIGARGGNGAGVAGVNWNVTIIGAKFLGPDGGTTADAVEAVNYITDLKTRHGLSVVATNNSWGGGSYSTALHQAIINAAKQDILFIAAAGNLARDNDAIATYPANYKTTVGAGSVTAASYEGVISVASITSTGGLSSFSNFGATTVDVGAPGSGIYSTKPQNGYGDFSGTSMATPHVTGAAAVYKAMVPGGTAAQIRGVLLNQGSLTSSLSGKTVTGRRLNVGDFSSTSLPSTFSKSSPGNGAIGFTTSVTLAWNSASGATSYDYCLDTTNDNACSSWTSNGSAISVVVTVQTGNVYFWQVRAANAAGATEADSGTWWVVATVGGAKFSSVRGAPVCLGPASVCDSGVLLDGRDTMSNGPEPNQPNTLNNSCSDGSLGEYHDDESIDRIRVYTTDGTDFAPGKTVRIDATVWAFSISNRLDLFYAANAASPSWTYLTTLTPSGSGARTLSATYVLPTGTVQAVRARFSFNASSTAACPASNGDYTDVDDLAFRVEGDAFTDEPLTPSVHQMRAVHLTELRTRINDVRSQYGLSAASWTDATLGTAVTARTVHISEMRTAVNALYTALSRTVPTYTDPALVAGESMIKAAHITELRAAVKALE